jgi:hypothetical protein
MTRRAVVVLSLIGQKTMAIVSRQPLGMIQKMGLTLEAMVVMVAYLPRSMEVQSIHLMAKTLMFRLVQILTMEMGRTMP